MVGKNPKSEKMTSLHINPLYSFIKCPNCGDTFELNKHINAKKAARNGTLYCDKCHLKFDIKDYVPNLTPLKTTEALREINTRLNKKARRVKDSEIQEAFKWVADVLRIPLQKNWRSVTFLRDLATILKTCKETGLDVKDANEAISILGSRGMSRGYRRYVADLLYASSEAVDYEKYEQILLRKIVNCFLAEGKSTVLVEIGSGVGRILHQYGCCISERTDACVPYRRYCPALYGHGSLVYPKGLRLLVGVDFEPRMVYYAMRWLQENNIYNLIREGQIIQVLGPVRHIKLSFKDTRYNEAIRFVCILFQTLGNQIGEESQIEMLKKAWEFASPRGLIFVSVFNASAFRDQAPSYYSSIKKSVGPALYCDRGVFLSSKGVYSKWFKKDELERLFDKAGFANYRVFDQKSLRTFSQYDTYISLDDQKSSKKRAIIGIAGEESLVQSAHYALQESNNPS